MGAEAQAASPAGTVAPSAEGRRCPFLWMVLDLIFCLPVLCGRGVVSFGLFVEKNRTLHFGKLAS